MIQIKVAKSRFKGVWGAMVTGYSVGVGDTIQEAIEDFLKINKLGNTPYKWK